MNKTKKISQHQCCAGTDREWSGFKLSRRPREEALVGRTGPALLPTRKLVFVVDDDPGMLRGVQRLLREHGYDSLPFASADAFQRHDNFGDGICVVLDINLNDDSGIDVRHRLKAAGVSLPVIFITGKDNPATRMAAIESGCLAYLTKPFAARSLMEPIERVASGLA
jgi:FixJ family two-component response regulator